MGTHTVPELSGTATELKPGKYEPGNIGISMMAKVEFQMLYTFELSQYTIKATLNGEEPPVVLDTESYKPYGWTIVSFASGAAFFRDAFEFALYDADGNVVGSTYTLYVEAFANKQIGDVYNDVAIAMMRYGDSVASYVATLG